MKLTERLSGVAQVRILGVEPEPLLNRCAAQGLRLWELRREDACSVCARLREKDLPALRELAVRCQCEVEITSLRGGSRDRALLRGRRVLLAALLLAAALLLVSSLFVWEIQVQGCEKLTEGQVLRALAECGVERGCYWPAISTDLVRSQMLTRVPELGWMTVNISGSRAVVLISERAEKPEIYREDQAADVVAGSSGVVRSVTVLNGHTQVQPGDVVLEGEVLVSGAMESLTESTRFVRAMAEIQADTWYEWNAVCPLEMLQIKEFGRSGSRLALQIGKNRVNLAFSRGKGLDECDKIVHEYNLGVEGLFALPITLIREERRSWSLTDAECEREEEMEAALLKRLKEQIDGEILSADFTVSRTDELLIVTLRAHCCENIARMVEITP